MALLSAIVTGMAWASDNPAAPIAAAAGHPSQHHVRAETSGVHEGQIVRSTLDVDGKTRLEQECQADLCHGSWFDGVRTFSFGINGTPFADRDRDDLAQRTFAAIASTAFAEPEFLAGGGRVAVNVRHTGEVRFGVKAAGAAELVAVADARTQRLVAIERSDGSTVAKLIPSGTAAASVYATRAYDRVAIVDAPLAAPAGPLVKMIKEEVEVALLPGPLPIVPCRLAGREATCLIDTGTSPSAMTLAFAERIGREPRGTIEIRGLGSYLTGVVDASPLDFGPASISGLHFAVIPQTHTADFDVILGSDALAQLRLELDPARHRVTVKPPAASSPVSADLRPAIEIAFGAGLPFADVRLVDRAQAEAMLVDTGDTQTVSIGYDEYRRDLGLFVPRGHSVSAGLGAAAMDAVDGELPSIDVGPAHLEHVAISAVRGQHQPHLGYGFAARCGRLILELGLGRVQCLGRHEGPEDVHR